jgi:hypothetical protein
LKQGTIGYDPAFATDLATKLRDVAGLQIVEVLQNYKMLSEPAQIIEALIKGKRVHHDGHPVLRWNWENAAVKTDDAGRIRPVKPKRASKRVDGAVALIMGDKALSISNPPPRRNSFSSEVGHERTECRTLDHVSRAPRPRDPFERAEPPAVGAPGARGARPRENGRRGEPSKRQYLPPRRLPDRRRRHPRSHFVIRN